jgi:site-specific recombinase XerD
MKNLQITVKEKSVVPVSEKNDMELKINQFFQCYSTGTLKAYSADLQCYTDFMNISIIESTETDVLKYIKTLTEKGYANSSINRRLSSLSKIFCAYQFFGYIEHNPVKQLSDHTKIFKPVCNTVKSLKFQKQDIEVVIANGTPRTAIIIKFLSTTALRISEMINIKNTDIIAYSTEYFRIKINGKGNKIRLVYITHDLYRQVKSVYNDNSEYLFSSKSGKKLSRTNLYHQINHAFDKHADRSDVHPHSLRHFWATEKIAIEKKDIKAVSLYLGHSSVNTCLNFYVDSELSANESNLNL